MKLVFALLSAITFAPFAIAQPYSCMFSDGGSVETQFPCNPTMIQKFGNRLVRLYPEIQQLNRTDEYMKNLYVMAMSACEEPFISMTPEQIGKNSEPFFPLEMSAAMARAAREVICPETE